MKRRQRYRFLAMLVILLVSILPRQAYAVTIYWPEQEVLLEVTDDYDTTDKVDLLSTSAEVDTEATYVLLPLNPCAVSVRPGTGEVAVKDTDCIKIYASASNLVERLTISCPGVISVSYSKDGRFLYACTSNSVLKYAVSETGYVQVSSRSATDVVAVAGGKGHEVWVLKKQALERWLGTPDGSYSPQAIATLTRGRSLSYSEAKNSVVVLDDTRIRYFAVAASIVEIAKYSVTVPGAIAVAQTESAIRVITKDGSRYYSVQPDGLLEINALQDTQKAYAVTTPNEKSQDFIVIRHGVGATGDLQYKAYSHIGYVENPAKQVASAASEVGYRREAELLSSAFTAIIPIDKVVATLTEIVPPNTGVSLDISTDGGVTWTTVTDFDEVYEVPEGFTFVYRLVLTTLDPLETPIVDRIELLQILTKAVGGGAGSRVRLVE